MSAVSLMAPQTLNMYTYCGNDPINYVDPSGLFFGQFFRWLGNLIMRLFRSGVAKKIAVRFVVSFIVSGGNFGVAVRSIVPDILSALGLAPPRYAVTPGWNSNLPYPYTLGGISSLSKYIIQNLISLAKKQWPCPLRWVLSGGILNRGKKALNDVLDSAWNDSTTGSERGKEQGGWVYMNKNKNVKAIRKVRDEYDGDIYINLGRPPAMAGWRVIATFHTHSEGFPNPSETVPGFATGDIDVNASQQVPGLIVGMNRHGERINTPYGPNSGYFGAGVPSHCQ